ncbi:MAG: winged helix-turn-helix transcriptional regulator [Promethearchaeota archaeon]|nr:MAG: winged helix-turn-helix transcriptional regulator [Candidatus Lokiarchaeota archaeon]
MSLEKRKDNKESEKGNILEESKFRRTDFTPLEIKKENQEVKEEKGIESQEFEVEDIVEELTEIEKDVLEIAEEILKLKRYDSEFEIESKSQIQKYPIIEKLYATSISKLAYNKGYSKEDIFLSIRNLEEKNWIVTNERRTKLEILNNEKLLSILDFIRENPGVHARDDKIEEQLGITRTPFIKHVITLERFELIRSKKIGKTLHYFLEDVTEEYDEIRAIFLNPLIPKIIEEIFKDETIAISSIGEMLEVYPGTINYHLKKMKDLNMVKSVKNKEGKKIHLVNVDLLKKYNSVFKEPDFRNLLKGL